MMTYHIDPDHGNDAADGLTPARSWRSLEGHAPVPGNRVLFKRGSVIRGVLSVSEGAPGAPNTYGAYGEGAPPVFLGSVPAGGDPSQWVEERPAVWRYAGAFDSEICNLIFNGGESCGNLRWSLEELRHAGEWHFTGIGMSTSRDRQEREALVAHALYLCAPDNPGRYYADIECALWGQRQLVRGRGHILIEDLCFANAGVHGYQAVHAHDVTIRRCAFRFIGGAVWNRERRIRFGNAIEFWDGASDIRVDDCIFDNIYDSGVTHQGGETRNIPERLYFLRNRFTGCGMSAYECREPSREVYFEHNVCMDSGGGFSPQGEPPPRQSEIHPQPMGHHVFVWRIEPGTQTGAVYIRHNVFEEAPYGSAIYSIIAPEDERHFVLDHNRYRQSSGTNLIHWGGRDYRTDEFDRYQRETGQDSRSRVME
jgi:hypothetical protein